MHKEHLAAELLIHIKYRRGLGGKKTRLAFWSKLTFGMVFIHRVEYTLQGGSYNSLILWHLSDYCKVHFTLDYQVQIFPA